MGVQRNKIDGGCQWSCQRIRAIREGFCLVHSHSLSSDFPGDKLIHQSITIQALYFMNPLNPKGEPGQLVSPNDVQQLCPMYCGKAELRSNIFVFITQSVSFCVHTMYHGVQMYCMQHLQLSSTSI
ncbi:hypothetical protein ILYODFUR_023569 [Ilyodon furcidens]|uniref:Uncharacterized protein n=1 Tax=Ilyodon furcidens TaxID=33524 RepID=A0ABV0U0V6_9TELE